MIRGLLQRFREGLRKTTPTFHRLFGQLGDLMGGRSLDPASLEVLEEALYGADFGVVTATEMMDEIRAAYRKDRSLKGLEAAALGAAVLRRVLQGAEGRFGPTLHRPEVVALIGVNGSGKTTTAAKLGWRLQQEGRTVLLGACDTFRAAANEQIQTWCDRLGLELVASQHGADAAAVAFDAWSAAVKRGRDVLLLDTAGRLHTKHNLMEELRKIRRVLERRDAEAPHQRWLVLDGSVGSNSLEQARVFHREFGVNGLIVTKLDGTSRGGALVGIYRELKIPIWYVGLGEGAEDLQPFSVEAYIQALFGPPEGGG